MTHAARVVVEHDEVDGCLVADLTGVLDSLTYSHVRDCIVKLALEEPRAVVARLDSLDVTSDSLLSVFSSASVRVSEWPDVPVFLVAQDADRRTAIAGNAVSRFVPVYPCTKLAVQAASSGVSRRRTHATFPPRLMCSGSARNFVRETCQRWGLDSIVPEALCIASELVENAIEHAKTELDLRLELRSGALTIAVRDGSPKLAVLRQGKQGPPSGYGLQIISDVARSWGCAPDLGGGKITWATLGAGRRWFDRHPEWSPAIVH
jgi:hypothetical protein